MLAQLFFRIWGRVEEIAGIEIVVASEIIDRAVQRIRSRLQTEVNDCAWLPSIFSGRVFLRVEFLDSVNRQDRPGCALHTFSIDYGGAVVRIVVVRPVDNKIVVLWPITVRADRKKSAAGGTLHAWA